MIRQRNVSAFKEKLSRTQLQTSWHKLVNISVQSDIPTDEERYGEIK